MVLTALPQLQLVVTQFSLEMRTHTTLFACISCLKVLTLVFLVWHSHVHLYATTAAGDEGRSNDAYNLQGD